MIEAELVNVNDTEDIEFLDDENSVVIPESLIQQKSEITGS